MVLNNEGELNFLWCVIGIAIGALIGFACTFTKMSEDAKEQERSRRSLWQEAVVRGYADELEAEDGKLAYLWKER